MVRFRGVGRGRPGWLATAQGLLLLTDLVIARARTFQAQAEVWPVLYRLLGVGAKIADQTVLFFILLFVWFPPLYWAGKLLHEDDLTYDQTTVSNLAKGWQAPPDHHLLITGTLRTDLALQTKWAKGHNINGETFVPLLDGNGQNVLLVEYSSRSERSSVQLNGYGCRRPGWSSGGSLGRHACRWPLALQPQAVSDFG